MWRHYYYHYLSLLYNFPALVMRAGPSEQEAVSVYRQEAPAAAAAPLLSPEDHQHPPQRSQDRRAEPSPSAAEAPGLQAVSAQAGEALPQAGSQERVRGGPEQKVSLSEGTATSAAQGGNPHRCHYGRLSSFNSVNSSFNSVNSSFNSVNSSFNSVNSSFNSVNSGLLPTFVRGTTKFGGR